MLCDIHFSHWQSKNRINCLSECLSPRNTLHGYLSLFKITAIFTDMQIDDFEHSMNFDVEKIPLDFYGDLRVR